VVFKLDSSGQETLLYTFMDGTDGGFPIAGVSLDKAGNLYGTTSYGGAEGLGAVFEVDAAGKETVLYSFTGTTDGANPQAGVVRDSAGNLYGTSNGGEFHCPRCESASGIVYELDTSGALTVLYAFNGLSKGNSPNGVIRSSSGSLYGTTEFDGLSGGGVIFKIKP
jgi:uncharacterized repeat protein (TIGR03803 family)